MDLPPVRKALSLSLNLLVGIKKVPQLIGESHHEFIQCKTVILMFKDII